MDATAIAVAIVGGAVTIAASILGAVPSVGRIRKLERIVALLKDVDDEDGHRKLLAIRDRLLEQLEPRSSDYKLVNWGFGVAAFGILSGTAGLLMLTVRGGDWESGLHVAGNIALAVGIVAVGGGLGGVLVGLVGAVIEVWVKRKRRFGNRKDGEPATEDVTSPDQRSV